MDEVNFIDTIKSGFKNDCCWQKYALKKRPFNKMIEFLLTEGQIYFTENKPR